MGQQQLLLIALSVIIVGAAVAVGVNMFQEGSQNAERELIYQQAPYAAAKASEAWRKPTSLGGLNYTYTNLTGTNAARCQWLGLADTMGQLVITSIAPNGDSTLTFTFNTMGSGYTGVFNVTQNGNVNWTTRP